jgi:hypothetical protein
VGPELYVPGARPAVRVCMHADIHICQYRSRRYGVGVSSRCAALVTGVVAPGERVAGGVTQLEVDKGARPKVVLVESALID